MNQTLVWLDTTILVGSCIYIWMKEQLKKVLTVALEEKYPEVKNIIIVPNEYIENKFDCVLNIDYEDFLKMDATELKILVIDYAKYLGAKIDTVVFY